MEGGGRAANKVSGMEKGSGVKKYGKDGWWGVYYALTSPSVSPPLISSLLRVRLISTLALVLIARCTTTNTTAIILRGCRCRRRLMRVRDLILIRARGPHGMLRIVGAGLRTWAAVQVGVAANSREVRGVVQRRQVRDEPLSACPVAVARGERAVGTHARGAVELLGDVTVVVRGLPVDGLHAVLERAGGPELPLADDGPDDARGGDAAADRGKDDDGVAGDFGAAAQLGGR